MKMTKTTIRVTMTMMTTNNNNNNDVNDDDDDNNKQEKHWFVKCDFLFFVGCCWMFCCFLFYIYFLVS